MKEKIIRKEGERQRDEKGHTEKKNKNMLQICMQ